MSVEINVRYEGGLKCTATHVSSGISLTTDAPKDNGGKGGSFSPTDLVATAFGTCVMTIMGLLAERDGINLAGTNIHIVKEMATHPARRIGKLETTITFPKGIELSDAVRTKLERAVESCPVKQSLHPDIKAETRFIYPE